MLAGTAKISVTEYDEGGFVVNNIVRAARTCVCVCERVPVAFACGLMLAIYL